MFQWTATRSGSREYTEIENNQAPAMNDAGNGQNRARKQNGGGKQAMLQGRGIGNVPQVNGLPQIVGLALGSPEFQRH